ncbi:MAG: XrtA/PEP-CTERM system TPR-repeat protein PrsT [Thermodesulfovibrionales bacterium]
MKSVGWRLLRRKKAPRNDTTVVFQRTAGTLSALTSAVLFLLLLGTGCSEKGSGGKEQLFRKGVQMLQENNPRGAVVLLRNALEEDPNFFEARFQLARAYARAGNNDAAERELGKVVLQSPSFPEAHIELARIHVQKNKPDEALRELGALGGNAASAAEVLEISGWARALKGELPEAVELLRRSLRQDGGRSSAAVALARVFLMRGEKDGAKRQIADVLRREPAQKDALFLLASIQTSEHATDEALATYDRIIAAHPSLVDAPFKKGVLLIGKGQHGPALALSEALIRDFPHDAQGYSLKGMALFYRKQFNDAVIALQKSLSLSPSSGGYYFLGLSHYYRNEPEQALSQLQRALDLTPSFTQARILVALVLLQQKRTDDAITEAKKALGDGRDNALARNILGSAYMAKGLYDEGMAELDKAAALDPKLVEIHIKKGLYHLNRGRLTEAETELSTAVRITPDVLNTRLVLASYYLKTKEYGKAEKTLREGLRGGKADAVLYNNMAAALMAAGRSADALRQLRKAKEADPDYLTPYFNIAAYHAAKGDSESALDEYRAVLRRSPGNLAALLGSAALLEAKGKEQEALAVYKKANESRQAQGVLALASYYLRKKDTGRALETLDEAIQADPRSSEALELKGKIRLGEKRYRDALSAFGKIEAYDPDRALPLIVNACIEAGEYKTALKKVEDRLQRQPGRDDLAAEAARLHLLMGDRRKAEETASALIRQKPGSPYGYRVLASVLESGNDLDKAIGVLKEALTMSGDDAAVRTSLALLYTRKGEYALALGAYESLLKRDAGNVAVLFGMGTVYDLMGNKKEAVAKYRQLLGKSGDHVPALNNLAFLYAEGHGSSEEALALASKAYRIAPGNAEVMDTLGYLLLKKGRTEEASKMLEKAASLLPGNPTVQYHAALALKERGDKGRAVELLSRAVRTGDFPEAGAARVLLAELRGGR